MNKKFECILIDLDGTIINSGPDLIDSLNYVLKKQKLNTIEKNIIGDLVGGGAEAMIKKAYNFLGMKIPSKKMNLLIKDFLHFYYINCTRKSYLYDNIESSLRLLNSGFKIGLCTNKKQDLTEKILYHFKLDKYLNLVVGSTPGLKLKPDVEMLEYSLKTLEAKAKNSIMVGDSCNDIIPAKKLGMKSIFVNYGFGSLNKSIQADYSVDKFSEIIKIVNS